MTDLWKQYLITHRFDILPTDSIYISSYMKSFHNQFRVTDVLIMITD